MKQIKDLEKLKEIASNGTFEGFILLNGGLRSSKDLEYDESTDTWHIYNHIDDTKQRLTTPELDVWTNIIKALNSGALYQY